MIFPVGVMDIQKEEDDFNAWFNKQTINAVPDADLSLQRLWASLAWQAQAAKAQAVPDTYTPIVLALEDVQSKIAKASFLTMDADNENEVYAVGANELHEYIAELIEAQEPK